MKKYIFCLFIVVIGLLLFFAPVSFAAVCPLKPDGSCMKCHWMGKTVQMLGGLITALGVIFLISKKARFGIAFSNIGLGICVILLATIVIGTCKTPAMVCNMYTKPTAMLLAIALIAINTVYVFLNRKENTL